MSCIPSSVNSKELSFRPLTGTSDDPKDRLPITPSMLNTGYKCQVPIVVEPIRTSDINDCPEKRLKNVNKFTAAFWRTWSKEYLTTLQERQKWTGKQRNIQVGDVVLLKNDNQPRNLWPMGRVIQTHADKENLVRSVKLKTQHGELTRPVTKLILLLHSDTD